MLCKCLDCADECPETDLKRSGLDSGENAAERERLNADLERGGLPSCSAGSDRLSSSPPEAEEAPSSLCSIEINPNQAHNHHHDLHQKQLHHHSHQTSIMNVIWRCKIWTVAIRSIDLLIVSMDLNSCHFITLHLILRWLKCAACDVALETCICLSDRLCLHTTLSGLLYVLRSWPYMW